MAPHVIKESYFEIFAKKIQNIMNDVSSEKFLNNLYVVVQVIIWMLISSVTTYYLIKINYVNLY